VDPAANGFRMLTSMEWELAAKYKGADNSNGAIEYPEGSGYWWMPSNYASGAAADYTNDDETKKVAWTEGNVHYIKKLAPNNLGIYDMCGNAWSWCFDLCSKESGRARRGMVQKWWGVLSTVRCSDPCDFHDGGFRIAKNPD
jgi:formylglycine-generating enzyme required for sulfatase activity